MASRKVPPRKGHQRRDNDDDDEAILRAAEPKMAESETAATRSRPTGFDKEGVVSNFIPSRCTSGVCRRPPSGDEVPPSTYHHDEAVKPNAEHAGLSDEQRRKLLAIYQAMTNLDIDIDGEEGDDEEYDDVEEATPTDALLADRLEKFRARHEFFEDPDAAWMAQYDEDDAAALAAGYGELDWPSGSEKDDVVSNSTSTRCTSGVCRRPSPGDAAPSAFRRDEPAKPKKLSRAQRRSARKSSN